MHLILGACCEKLPPGIFYPAPLEACGLTILIANPGRYYFLHIVCVCGCVLVCVCVCVRVCVRAYNGIVP